MPAAARVGDHHTCPKCEPGPTPHVGGAILPSGCPTVLVHGQPAARVGDRCTCKGPADSIVMGEPTVLIGNSPAARVGDPTAHGGVIVAGCGCVQIGHVAQAIVLKRAAKNGTAFCEECARKKAEREKGKAPKKRAPAKPLPFSEVAPPTPVTPPPSAVMDIGRALDHLNSHALDRSVGRCVSAVAGALAAGGANFIPTLAARDAGPNLLRAGLQAVAQHTDLREGRYTPAPGDVAVLDAAPSQPWGHMSMWNGAHWVSDHKQQSLYPARAFEAGALTVFRP